MVMSALNFAAKESKIMKFFLGGFIFLAVGGLVFTDVKGMFTGGISGTHVAEINGTKIEMRDFDRELQTFARQYNMTTADAYQAGIANALLQNRIDSTLKLQMAQDLDLNLDNKVIAAQLKAVFGNASREQIESTLQAQGLTERQLANNVRVQSITQIINSMTSPITKYVPKSTQSAQEKVESLKFNGNLYTVSFNAFDQGIEVSDQDIQSEYDNNPQNYAISEERSFKIGTMTLDIAKKSLPPINDTDIKANYEARKDEFTVPETRMISQAIVTDADEAQDIYAATLEGVNLKDAVKKISGSFDAYSDAAAYTLNTFPEDLRQKAFADDVALNKTMPPVKTAFGYNIMTVESIKPSELKSFETVKNDIKKELSEKQLYDALYNQMIDIEDMVNAGAKFDSIAEKIALKTQETGQQTREFFTNNDSPLKKIVEDNPAVLEEIFTLPENGLTYPIELGDDKFVVIGVQSIRPQELIPLVDVKKDIEKKIRQDKLKAIVASQSDGILTKLKSEDTQGLELLKKNYNATKTSFSNIGKNSEDKNASLIFDSMYDGFGVKINDNETVTFVEITKVNIVNGSSKELETDTLVTQQDSIIDSLLTTYLRENTKIRMNDELLKQTYTEGL